MSIQLVTYANQTVTPMNDAIIYEKAVNQNGIFNGCNVTVTSNEVHITGGYGLICGREFVINSEVITVTLAPSGTLLGRLYVRLDLADADAPIQLLTVTGNTLPALVQDADVNYTNGVYEMELATFVVGVSALSNVVETYETIRGSLHDDGSGNVKLAGNLTLENHASAVGWYDLHNNTTSLSSSTSLAKITASEITLSPGRYILMASANFSSSTSGFRGIAIGDTSASYDESRASQATLSSSGWTTSMNTSCFVNITTTTNVYMYAFQNSGSSLSTAWIFKAVRIR